MRHPVLAGELPHDGLSRSYHTRAARRGSVGMAGTPLAAVGVPYPVPFGYAHRGPSDLLVGASSRRPR